MNWGGAVRWWKVEGGYARPAFMAALGTQTVFNVGLRHRF